MALNPKLEFDEQEFMWDMIDQFSNRQLAVWKTTKKEIEENETADDVEPTTLEDKKDRRIGYDNFTKINSDNPIALVNKMMGQEIDSLNGLSNAQLSSLTPKIKLYKLVPKFKGVSSSGHTNSTPTETSEPGALRAGLSVAGNQSEEIAYQKFETGAMMNVNKGTFEKYEKFQFPFGANTTLYSITNSIEDRGTDAGIKNLSIRDTGVNPANVGISWKGTIEFYFQSVESLFKNRYVDGHTLTFAELMDLTSLTGDEYRDSDKVPSETLRRAAAALNCMPPFEIQLELGWSYPDDTAKAVALPVKQIDKLTRRFKLYPAEQKMDISENGSLTLSLEFWAAAEAKSLSSAADLLYVDESQISETTKKISDARNEYYQLKIAKMNSRATNLTQLMEAEGDPLEGEGSAMNRSEIAANRMSMQALLSGQENEALADARKKWQAATSQSKEASYARLLMNIRNNSRLFSYDLPGHIIDDYLDMKQIIAVHEVDFKQDKKVTEEEKKYVKSLRNMWINSISKSMELGGAMHGGNADLIAQTPTEQAERAEAANAGTTADPVTQTQKAKQESKTNSSKPIILQGGIYRINFFYLGDLLEGIMNIIYEQPEFRSNGSKSPPGQTCKNIKNHVKLLVGPYIHLDPATGKKIIMNIADIPVSLRYFNAWFFETVTKHRLAHLPLRQFLKNLCSSLLNNLVSPKRVGINAEPRNLRPQVQTLNVPVDGLLERYGSTGDPNPPNKGWHIINYDSLEGSEKNFLAKGKTGQVNDWLFLYIAGSAPTDDLNGSVNADAGWNIPHFWVGKNTGLLKKVKFHRTKLAYRLEMSLQRSANPAKRNLLFADRYDAELTFVGNPAFKPGMLIYIDATSLGLEGGPFSPTNPEWQSDLGVGGYYRIIDVTHTANSDKFETNLRTIAELTTRDMKLRKVLKEASAKGDTAGAKYLKDLAIGYDEPQTEARQNWEAEMHEWRQTASTDAVRAYDDRMKAQGGGKDWIR